MATRSVICKMNPNWTFDGIYCHNDGYIEGGVGETLFKHYQDPRKVDALIAGGDISVLGSRIDAPKGHSSQNRAKDCTVFYHRDGGEKLSRCNGKNINELIDNIGVNGIEYIYLFNSGEWFVYPPTSSYSYNDKKARSLADFFNGKAKDNQQQSIAKEAQATYIPKLITDRVLRQAETAFTEQNAKKKLKNILPGAVYRKYEKDLPCYNEASVLDIARNCGISRVVSYENGDNILVNFYVRHEKLGETFFQFNMPKALATSQPVQQRTEGQQSKKHINTQISVVGRILNQQDKLVGLVLSDGKEQRSYSLEQCIAFADKGKLQNVKAVTRNGKTFLAGKSGTSLEALPHTYMNG